MRIDTSSPTPSTPLFLFLLRRILLVVPVLFGLLALTFVLTRIVPSDPAATLAGDQATPAQLAEIRAAYGFDRPIPEQFVRYLVQLGRGDLGYSYFTRRPVIEDLVERLPATLELTFFALLISVGLGIPLGVVAALNHNRWPDQLLRVFSVGGIAIASFWLALMLQLVFSMELDLLPLRGRISITGDPPPSFTGAYLIDALLAGRPDIFEDALSHLVLPAATLAFGSLATIVRFSRSGVLETLQKDFVTFETAIGYPRWIIIGKYVLRNSLVSTITQIGLLFGGLIAGAVVVEAIFDWPGIGGYAAGAIFTADFQPLLGVTLLIGAIYAVVNILVDPIHAWIDPRVAEQLCVNQIWKKFVRDRSALSGLVIIALVLVVALLAYRVAPFPEDAFASDPIKRLRPPDWTHWFGTDSLGRDVLSRVILGTRIALGIAVSVVAASMAIGVPLGLIAGYFGGWRGEFVMRVTDVFLAVPQLILALALAQILRPSLESAMTALTLTYWPFFTRVVYAETRRLRELMFVEALEGLGARPLRIMFLHILPNVASPVIVRATIGMGYAILTAAVLGFLGMGAPPPQPEWGLMVSESREFLPDAWWFATFPGLAIFLVVFAFNLLGDGLRDIVDPRLRRSR